jgi:hypothetical protein
MAFVIAPAGVFVLRSVHRLRVEIVLRFEVQNIQQDFEVFVSYIYSASGNGESERA